MTETPTQSMLDDVLKRGPVRSGAQSPMWPLSQYFKQAIIINNEREWPGAVMEIGDGSTAYLLSVRDELYHVYETPNGLLCADEYSLRRMGGHIGLNYNFRLEHKVFESGEALVQFLARRGIPSSR